MKLDWLRNRDEIRCDVFSVATAIFERFVSKSYCNNYDEDIRMLVTYFSRFNLLLSKNNLDKSDIDFLLGYFTIRHIKDILNGRELKVSDGIANYISTICNRKLKMILGKDLKKSEIKKILNSIC